jgi:anti-sigma factor ChrR (cupin superfamily)
MKHATVEEELEENAALYALGALNQHEARSLDQHLEEGCEVCAAELKEFESVVEALGHAAPEAAPPAGAREKLLSLLSAEPQPHAPVPTAEEDEAQKPLVVRADEGRWYEMSAGVLCKRLFVDPTRNTVTTLLKLDPGARMPMHRHRGIEECYVIEGDVRTNNQNLKTGDYTCAMEGSIHHPITTINGALLLIVAPQSYEVLER